MRRDFVPRAAGDDQIGARLLSFAAERANDKMSNPGLADIFSVASEGGWGSSPAPGASGANLGISGPRLPGVEWAPRGGYPAWGALMQALAGGIAPTSHGHIQIKSYDFISRQYNTPPWGDEREKYVMPDMICFTMATTIGPHDGPEDGVVLTLGSLNSMLDEEDKDFREEVQAGHAASVAFRNYLEHFGESILEHYHSVRGHEHRKTAFLQTVVPKTDRAGISTEVDLELFYRQAKEEHYCWLTKFGILQRIRFCGSVMNVNRGTSLEGYMDLENRERWTQVVAGIAKRVRVANVFGEHDQVQTGSKLWVSLKRKPHYMNPNLPGAYCVYPEASMGGWPSVDDRAHADWNGARMEGHAWAVGVVYSPPVSWAAQSACQRAANCEARSNERAAYEFHATIPTMYALVGFEW